MASYKDANRQPPELFRKSNATDITLLVGVNELHFAKFPLIQGSDVFAQMIEKSADQSKLQIYDVDYKDMLMFLECLHPKTLESITDKNLQPVLSIANRFEHKGILKKCEEYLIQQFRFPRNPPNEMYPEYFSYLNVAEKYGLDNALRVGVSSRRVQKAYFSSQQEETTYYGERKNKIVKGYEDDSNFEALSFKIKFGILCTRLKIAEAAIDRNDLYLQKKQSLFGDVDPVLQSPEASNIYHGSRW